MFYSQPVYRPPSEGDSLLLQVTVGCSRRSCRFCVASLQKEYYARSLQDVTKDVDEAAAHYRNEVRKVFFLAASAFAAPTGTLHAAATRCTAQFPNLKRISSYAHPADILGKTDDELRSLYHAGIRQLYIGIESGSDNVLRLMRKSGNTSQLIRACRRVQDIGYTISCQVIIGLGGATRSIEHATETARVVSEIGPSYLGVLNLMVVPNTGLDKLIEGGQFRLQSTSEYLDELERLVAALAPQGPMELRTTHPSNLLPTSGQLPRDHERILRAIRDAKSECATKTRDEFLRNV